MSARAPSHVAWGDATKNCATAFAGAGISAACACDIACGSVFFLEQAPPMASAPMIRATPAQRDRKRLLDAIVMSCSSGKFYLRLSERKVVVALVAATAALAAAAALAARNTLAADDGTGMLRKATTKYYRT